MTMMGTSPIEQFEIFFLTTPVLSEVEMWGSLPLWYDAAEGVTPELAFGWVLLLTGMLLLTSDQTDEGGYSLVWYVPVLLLAEMGTGDFVVYALIALLFQQAMEVFLPHQVAHGHSGSGSARPNAMVGFAWGNFDVVRLFPLIWVILPLGVLLTFTNMLSFAALVVLFLGTFLCFWVGRHSAFALMYRLYVGAILGALGDQDIEAKNYKYGLFLIPIFLVILVANLIGMLPYNYTLTSHICFTFTISMSFFIGINLVGLMLNRENLLLLFLPGSAPPAISVFLIFIETLSYLARMLSLAIRLFANVVAGHILLKILSNFLLEGLLLGGYINLFIIAIVQSFFFLETGVAFLQAYIFLTLCTIYLKDTVSDTTHH